MSGCVVLAVTQSAEKFMDDETIIISKLTGFVAFLGPFSKHIVPSFSTNDQYHAVDGADILYCSPEIVSRSSRIWSFAFRLQIPLPPIRSRVFVTLRPINVANLMPRLVTNPGMMRTGCFGFRPASLICLPGLHPSG
jgi:hypothetical protein